jgi:hypothetical protein
MNLCGPQCLIVSRLGTAHGLWKDVIHKSFFQSGHDNSPAFSSAKRAPTRSECFRNLSAQFMIHASCTPKHINIEFMFHECDSQRTSFPERALLVKSLQHDTKHLSTSPEYIFMKSCI